nr:DNA-3-methyladenine glycosylase [Roseibium hamelinense]
MLESDPRLQSVAEQAGDIPLRRRPADFAGLAHIVTGQQVSVASASAIFARLQDRFDPLTSDRITMASDQDLADVGLSRPKIRTLRAVCKACHNGLSFNRLVELPADQAHARLCEIKGIGRWSADIFLLFCAGHPDIFPSGDLALQIAVQKALGLEARPKPQELDEIANAWAPWRAVAARLFWSWYKAYKNSKLSLPL